MPGLSDDPSKRSRQLANLRRGETRPEPANRRAVKHGAYAAVARDRIDAKVREVFDALAEDAPLRAPDGGLPAEDTAMVRLAAEVLCRLDDVTSYLSARGWLDEKGKPRTVVLELEGRLRREAGDFLEAMGMSPRSRAKLGLDLARTQTIDLAAHWNDVGDQADVIDGDAA
jgi:hypothetical protein